MPDGQECASAAARDHQGRERQRHPQHADVHHQRQGGGGCIHVGAAGAQIEGRARKARLKERSELMKRMTFLACATALVALAGCNKKPSGETTTASAPVHYANVKPPAGGDWTQV